MSAAEQRVSELLERWQASVALHMRYLDLNDAAYARVQDWPQHQRPTRWVLELANARLNELRRRLDERHARGDEGFGEALELMGFLTNLLGSEHLERFVPLAVQPPVTPAPRSPPSPKPPQAATPRATEPVPASLDKTAATVVADAVRLLRWGREWPQLAGLIARLANRPGEQDVWQILRKHRAAIESQAQRPRD